MDNTCQVTTEKKSPSKVADSIQSLNRSGSCPVRNRTCRTTTSDLGSQSGCTRTQQIIWFMMWFKRKNKLATTYFNSPGSDRFLAEEIRSAHEHKKDLLTIRRDYQAWTSPMRLHCTMSGPWSVMASLWENMEQLAHTFSSYLKVTHVPGLESSTDSNGESMAPWWRSRVSK